jgi:hypothetical protein
MNAQPTGQYVTTAVAGESVEAFVPNPLLLRLTSEQLAPLAEPLREAQTALVRLDLAGEMIPSIDWFIYAFVRNEARRSAAVLKLRFQEALRRDQGALLNPVLH